MSRGAKGVPADDPAPSITVAVKSAYVTPAGAEVAVLVSEDGESSAILIQLVNEGGIWKVSDLLLSLVSGSDRRPI